MKVLLSILARILGILVKRPISGLWLARYFAGHREVYALPKRLETELYTIAKQQTLMLYCDCDTWKDFDFDPQCEKCKGTGDLFPLSNFTVWPERELDLYTCVGSISCQWDKDGTLFYRDVYDWHSNLAWDFDVEIIGLPFSISIKGKDKWLASLGNEFLTAGTIYAP